MLICGAFVAKEINLAASQNFINGWRWSLVACAMFASPVFLLSFLLNETPRYLIKHHCMEEEKLVLRRIRRSGADAEFHKLTHLIENEDKEQS